MYGSCISRYYFTCKCIFCVCSGDIAMDLFAFLSSSEYCYSTTVMTSRYTGIISVIRTDEVYRCRTMWNFNFTFQLNDGFPQFSVSEFFHRWWALFKIMTQDSGVNLRIYWCCYFFFPSFWWRVSVFSEWMLDNPFDDFFFFFFFA